MRILILAALALSIVPPVALADGIEESSFGTCDPGDPRTDSTTISAAGASVTGSSWCNFDSENGSATTVDSLAVSANGSTLTWAGSSTGGCALYLQQGEDFTMSPVCPAGPPNPGWGHLLP